jgi:hypothetical protein
LPSDPSHYAGSTVVPCLITIPFVPLRTLFERDFRATADTYSVLTSRIAASLNLPKSTMELIVPTATCSINQAPISLSAIEFALCAMLASRRIAILPHLHSITDLYSALAAYLQSPALASFPKLPEANDSFNRRQAADLRKLAASVRSKFTGAVGRQLADLFAPSIAGQRGVYGMQADPANIHLINVAEGISNAISLSPPAAVCLFPSSSPDSTAVADLVQEMVDAQHPAIHWLRPRADAWHTLPEPDNI